MWLGCAEPVPLRVSCPSTVGESSSTTTRSTPSPVRVTRSRPSVLTMSPSSTPCSWLLVPAITGAPLVSSPFGVVLWSDAAAGSASVGPAAGAATGEGAIVVAGVDAPGERSAPPAAPDPVAPSSKATASWPSPSRRSIRSRAICSRASAAATSWSQVSARTRRMSLWVGSPVRGPDTRSMSWVHPASSASAATTSSADRMPSDRDRSGDRSDRPRVGGAVPRRSVASLRWVVPIGPPRVVPGTSGVRSRGQTSGGAVRFPDPERFSVPGTDRPLRRSASRPVAGPRTW